MVKFVFAYGPKVDHLTGNQSWKLLKITKKRCELPVNRLSLEKQKISPLQIRSGLRYKKPFVSIQSASHRTNIPLVGQLQKIG